MDGYTKLFGSLVHSSIWSEDDKTRIVWITMLAMMTARGLVQASVSGLAHAARVSPEDCKRALARLEAPDPDSTSPEHEGRRISRVEGGWLVLNAVKYQVKLSIEERRAYKREWQRKYREELATKPASGHKQGVSERERQAQNEHQGEGPL